MAESRIVFLGGISAPCIIEKNSRYEKVKFAQQTNWLRQSFTTPEGTYMPLPKMFEKAYQKTESEIMGLIARAVLEQKMLATPVQQLAVQHLSVAGNTAPIRQPSLPEAPASIQEPDTTDVGTSNMNAESDRQPFVAGNPASDDLTIEDDVLLFEWYATTCPQTHSNWFLLVDELVSHSKSKKAVLLADMIKIMRENLFASSNAEIGIAFWKKLIDHAYRNRDTVNPSEMSKEIDKFSTKKLLGLLPDTVNPASTHQPETMSFSDYLGTIDPEFKERVKAHAQLLNWLMAFYGWKEKKKKTHLLRYLNRKDESTPSGKQCYWENILRLHRLLDGWKIVPPKDITPLDEDDVTFEKVQNTLHDETSHPLKGNTKMIEWFVAVNKRILEKTRKNNKTGKKRVTPDDSKGNNLLILQHSTCYSRWIESNGRKMTLLEVVENSQFGGTHFALPEMNPTEHVSYFSMLLNNIKSTKKMLPGFPASIEINEGVASQYINYRQLPKPEAVAFGALKVIYSNQKETLKRDAFKKQNESREAASLPPLSFHEWEAVPASYDVPRESWLTGRKLNPGCYTTVIVESSNDPKYETIRRLRVNTKTKFLNPDANPTEESEFESRTIENTKTNNCAICQETIEKTDLKVLHVHKAHMGNFYTWATRKRQKGIKSSEEDEYKMKYTKLINTIKKWAKEDDDSEELLKDKIEKYLEENTLK